MKYFGPAILAMAIAACSPANGGDAAEGSAEAAAREGPFGFDMGQKIEEVVGAEKLDRPGLYVVKTLPKPHADFEQVVLEAYPKTGICLIRGIGKDIGSDGAGLSIRSKVDGLKDALETKYGSSKKMDRCGGSQVGCLPQFWVSSLLENERIYAHIWEEQSEGMKSANIGEMVVGAQAANILDTYPILEFYSADEKACEAARNAVSADAL